VPGELAEQPGRRDALACVSAACCLLFFAREAGSVHVFPPRSISGGTAEQFRRLVEARDRLLAALGTSAPAPKAPAYAPKGAHIIYRRVKTGAQGRLGSTRRVSHG
jgi:hypothetical protein